MFPSIFFPRGGTREAYSLIMSVFCADSVFKTLARHSLPCCKEFFVNFVELFSRFFFVRQPEALIPFGALVGVLVETCQVCRACVAWADFGCNFCTRCSQHAEGLHTYGI